jgi:7-cyano-7-deazaguanine synthase in queuosine biosynthesis
MKTAVLWSGGLDSTYLIQKLLRGGDEVSAYYVEYSAPPHRLESERAAINKLLAHFKPYHFTYRQELISFGAFGNARLLVDLAQVPVWMLAGVFLPDGYDQLAIGYVTGFS